MWTGRAGLALIAVVMWGLGLQLQALASAAGPVVVTSPVHPRTFYIRSYPKLSQHLAWDEKTSSLVGRVSYSLYMTRDDALFNPANYTTFTLPFPDVHRDAQGNLFLPRGHHPIAIGRLTHGVFGTEVETNENVQFVAHRIHDQLCGQLIIDQS